MNQVVDFRLLPAAGAAWALVFVLVGRVPVVAVRAGLVAASLFVIVVLSALFRWRRLRLGDDEVEFGTLSMWLWRAHGQVAFVLLVLAVLSGITGAHLHAASSVVLDRSQGTGDQVEVLARVTGDPRLVSSWGGKPTYLVTLTTLSVRSSAQDQEQQAQAHLVLFADASWQPVRYGATIRTRAKVVRSADIGARERFRLVQPEAPILVAPPNALFSPFRNARAGLVQASEHLPEQARGLVPGVGVGDRSHLSADLATAMRVTGLTHITAVSGSHFAIVAAAVLAVTSLLRLPRPARVVLSAMAMAGFVLLVRPEPSVVRAALMGSFALAGMSMGRPARALTALAAAVIALLLADPWLARSYGFILSVCATAGLVLWAGPMTRFLSRWLPQWLALIIAVPAVAQAVCGPVVILLEPNFATYAIPANVLATPALAPAALCSVLAALLSTWWPAGAAALATCSGWASSWIAWVATFFANLPGAYPQWPAGGRGAVLLAMASAALVLIVLATPYVRHAVLSAVQARTRPWLRSGSSFGGQSWDS